MEGLEQELAWFTRVVDDRMRRYFRTGEPPTEPPPAPPDHGDAPSHWAAFLRKHTPSRAERLAVVLALVPHLRPKLLDVFFTRNATFDRRMTEFGGSRADDEFEPTGETLAFLLDGESLEARAEVAALLEPHRWLSKGGVLQLGSTGRDLAPMKSPLRISPEYLGLFTLGRKPRPVLSADFPAQRIETALGWDDLILHPGTLKHLKEIQDFVAHGHTLMHAWGMAPRLRPGHRALFHGPPGTGKTLSATLLGKASHRPVYRVDLSLVVSKYIGETEKSLARVFDRAHQQDWILFFDEADALFGKRTETKDAHDRYANQQISYLLQRIEDFDGVTVLASNMRENVDPAFSRRFESIVFFPLPRAPERLQLWKRGFSPKAVLRPEVDLSAIASVYELSGGSIMNVIRQVSLAAIADGERPITLDDIKGGIHRELAKEGKGA